MTIPYIGFGNDELNKRPFLRKGDGIICPHCGEVHHVKCGTNTKTGKESDTLMFYNCGEKSYLAGVAGRLIIGHKASISGEI